MQSVTFEGSYSHPGLSEPVIFSTSDIDDEFIEISVNRTSTGYSLAIMGIQPVTLQSLTMKFPLESCCFDTVLVNGFQSWSYSGFYSSNERRKGLDPSRREHWSRYRLDCYGDYNWYPYSDTAGSAHSYNWILLSDGVQSFLAGSLSEEHGYTVFKVLDDNLIIWKDIEGMELQPGSITKLVDIITTTGEITEVFDFYAEKSRHLPLSTDPVAGWTSWYNYFEKIDERIILDNLGDFYTRSIPLTFFQVDDGYQEAVGDWLLVSESFPHGMKYIAGEIHKAGYSAGIWIAPFIAEECSSLVKEHPDWILVDETGDRVIAGINNYNWSGTFYALDIFNLEYRTWLEEVFSTVFETWGYDMVKIDFIYAVAMIPHSGRSRGQVMDYALRFLSKVCSGKKILACGTPLGSVHSLVDFCRIGCDIGMNWEDSEGADSRYMERISTRNCLIDTISRSMLNRRFFLNDPDVFMLREDGNELCFNQRRTTFLVNQVLGSVLFTSDAVSDYSEETMSLYLSQFPLKQKEITGIVQDALLFTISFTCGQNSYRLIVNISDSAREIIIDRGRWFCARDNISSKIELLEIGDRLSVAPYSSEVLLLVEDEPWSVAGSFSHVIPGSEVESITVEKGCATVTFSCRLMLKPHLLLTVPQGMETVTVNGLEIETVLIAGVALVEYCLV
jgi:alpha-galactosidase